MKIREFVQVTASMVAGLNNSNWNQRIGCYKPGSSCCIGAHLAHWFHQESNCSGDFIAGEREAARFLGCTDSQLAWLLHAAGAPRYPFGRDPWPLHPTEVWKNLLLVETMPPEANTEEKLLAAKAWLQQQRKRIHEAQRQHQLGPAHSYVQAR